MTVTSEQRTYAKLAGIMMLAHVVLELGGDSVTIMARGGEGFAATARYAVEHAPLWRGALLCVGASWISLAILAVALYAVLEPVDKRLAQLALALRLGASFVGAGSLMFRYALTRLYQASVTESLFTPEQLRVLSGVSQRGANAGVWIAWLFMSAGYVLFFALFLRSRYLPGAIAWLGIFGSSLLAAATIVMFVFPEGTNWMKLLGLPALLAELATALWLLIKGLPRETAAPAT